MIFVQIPEFCANIAMYRHINSEDNKLESRHSVTRLKAKILFGVFDE